MHSIQCRKFTWCEHLFLTRKGDNMDPITFSGVVSFGIKLVLALGITKEVVTPLLVSAFGGSC